MSSVPIPYPLGPGFWVSDHPVAVWLNEHHGGLTLKRKAFVVYYLTVAEGNGTQAARLAGYAESGASTEAERLLRNAEIDAARIGVARLLGLGGQALEHTLIEAIYESVKIQRVKMKRPVLDGDGNPLVTALGKVVMEEYLETFEDKDLEARIKAAEKAKALGEGRKTEGVGESGGVTVFIYGRDQEPPAAGEHEGYYPAIGG